MLKIKMNKFEFVLGLLYGLTALTWLALKEHGIGITLVGIASMLVSNSAHR